MKRTWGVTEAEGDIDECKEVVKRGIGRVGRQLEGKVGGGRRRTHCSQRGTCLPG